MARGVQAGAAPGPGLAPDLGVDTPRTRAGGLLATSPLRPGDALCPVTAPPQPGSAAAPHLATTGKEQKQDGSSWSVALFLWEKGFFFFFLILFFLGGCQ